MFREKFLFNFLKYKQKYSHEIIKYNSNNKFDFQNQINIQINNIDQKIAENSQALLQAQIVKIRSTISRSNNFLETISKNVYKTKLEESIEWHKKQLKELYFKRRKLQIDLEKIQGIFWLNQIKRFLIFILISLFVVLSIFILLSGFMIIIYFLPIIILIFLGYLLTTKKY